MVEAPGQQRTEAQTKTPLLGPSGPACTFMFDFALTGKPDHIGVLLIGGGLSWKAASMLLTACCVCAGELLVQLVDKLGTNHQLWQFSGRTGADEGAWRHAAVHIGVRRNRFQVS